MKPSDFLLGVLDFFAILLPGSMATWLVTRYMPRDDIFRYLSLGPTPGGPDALTLAGAFLLSSYTLGHFVFMAGAQLDNSYDRWRRRAKPNKTFLEADKLRKESLESGEFTTLKWAKSYIQIHAPLARTEIDRLEADSKFFRSLVVISAPIALHFLMTERIPSMGVASGVLGLMAYWRFRDQRWKSTQLSYATAVILHNTKVAVASQKDLESATHAPAD